MMRFHEYASLSFLGACVYIIAMLLIGNNYNAMNKCQEKFSHDVCFNTIYK